MFEDTRNTVQEEIKSLSLPAKPRTGQDESPKKEITVNLESAAKSLEAAANEKFGRQQHYMGISIRTVKDILLKSPELNDDAKNLLSSTFSIIDKSTISIGELTEISKSISGAYKNGITEKEHKELLGKVLELRAPETAIEPLKKAQNHNGAIKIISDIVSSEQKEMESYIKSQNEAKKAIILDSKAILESLDKTKNKEIVDLIKSVEDAGCKLTIRSDGGFISVVGKGGYPVYTDSLDGFSFNDESVNLLEDNLKSANNIINELGVKRLNDVVNHAIQLTTHESVNYESRNFSGFSITMRNPEYIIKIPFPDVQELSRNGNLINKFDKYLKNLESVVEKLD